MLNPALYDTFFYIGATALGVMMTSLRMIILGIAVFFAIAGHFALFCYTDGTGAPQQLTAAKVMLAFSAVLFVMAGVLEVML